MSARAADEETINAWISGIAQGVWHPTAATKREVAATLSALRERVAELEAVAERLRDEKAMWRQQYERERVRLGYVLGWLTPESFGGDESKQHAYIAIMDTAGTVRYRLEGLKADLRAALAGSESLVAEQACTCPSYYDTESAPLAEFCDVHGDGGES